MAFPRERERERERRVGGLELGYINKVVLFDARLPNIWSNMASNKFK